MTLEREVKLTATPAFRMPSLHGLGDGVLAVGPEIRRLQTVYLDTEDLRLARWGVSLRHREGQGWTVKMPVGSDGDLLVRGEHTFPGDDPARPPEEALELLTAYLRSARLHPMIKLRTVRRSTLVRNADDAMLAEVDDDEVSVLAGRRITGRFRELEVEVGAATPPDLVEEIVKRLRAAGAGRPDPTPKYVRSVGTAAREPPEVDVTALPSGASAGEVVRRAIAVSVEHLIRHDVVMRLDADPEGVHKARVATRRLRSDLRTFRSLLDPEWTGSLRDELRRLGSVLGEARDADVLLERIRSRAETLPASEAPGVAEVIEALAQRRKEAHAALIETLRGDEYTDLLDRLVDAANDPRLLPDGDRPASEVLPALVRGPWKKLRRKVKRAGKDPTPAVLHAIRIRTKRVRYAADAAGPVMGKPARRFADDAADLQTVLGNHNDAVVAETWLRGWAGADGRSRDGTFAAGVLAGVERAAAHEAAGAWRSAWKHLRRPSNRRWMA